ncbi:MAG: putative bifunctional diguanylate cyclase/phosphodiesterase [Pyrinomonadaceae bacterium]
MLESNNSKARILIADDDLPIREVLGELLSDNYECVLVASAEEALARLAEESFDLILSDITMGGMTGLEMVPRVLELAPDTVVVMISGEQTIESAITALRAGAFDYITKPFDFRHVEAAVSRALEHHALRAAKRHYESHLEELVEARTDELQRANTSLREQIAERVRAEEKATHLVYYDTLTELPNQTYFKDRLTHELTVTHGGQRSQQQQQQATVFLSLDRFKKINETLGLAVGDQLLQSAAKRLAACLSKKDTVAYFGGDEFALLLADVGGAEDIAKIARRIQETLQLPFKLGEHEIYVTTSMGISLYPDDGEDKHDLMMNASAALHRAKQQGGDNYQFYTKDMNDRALKRLALENSLRRALEREEFLVYYQPKVCLATSQIVGMEALVRWQHPEMGLISPAEFIPLAEDTGLIVPLGQWVLRTACAQNKAWQTAGFKPLRVSVNLSSRQLQQPDLVEIVERAFTETGLDPRYLELELTESSVMQDAEYAVQVLRQLRAYGLKISVDDFGSGYSSLSYLKHLPIDILKLDQSFVSDMTTDPSNAAIVMAIITLAHNLKLEAIAEGVETEEQRSLLYLLKCDEMQGYLFSKPLPAEAFEQLLCDGQNAPHGKAALLCR